MRHMRIADLYVKEALRQRLLKASKLRTDENKSDIHTKHFDAKKVAEWKEENGYIKVNEIKDYVKVSMRKVNDSTMIEEVKLET